VSAQVGKRPPDPNGLTSPGGTVVRVDVKSSLEPVSFTFSASAKSVPPTSETVASTIVSR